MKLQITIDSNRCHGHGRCYALCPEAFDADDEGFGVVADVELPAGGADLEESVRRAAAGCPESAISVGL
jgi:ferredoxin